MTRVFIRAVHRLFMLIQQRWKSKVTRISRMTVRSEGHGSVRGSLSPCEVWTQCDPQQVIVRARYLSAVSLIRPLSMTDSRKGRVSQIPSVTPAHLSVTNLRWKNRRGAVTMRSLTMPRNSKSSRSAERYSLCYVVNIVTAKGHFRYLLSIIKWLLHGND